MRTFTASDTTVVLHDVTNGNTRHLQPLLQMMPEFFPHCEKFLPALERDARLTLTERSPVIPHQWVVEVDGQTAGFYIFDYRPGRGCGLSLFMGLYPEFRAISVNGFDRLARFLFVQSVRQIVDDARRLGQPTPLGLVGEIELGPLLERYRLYDFVELPVVYYEPMFPDPWTSMSPEIALESIHYEQVTLGMFHDSAMPKRALSASEVANYALAYLCDFYGLPADSMPVKRALATAQPFDWT